MAASSHLTTLMKASLSGAMVHMQITGRTMPLRRAPAKEMSMTAVSLGNVKVLKMKSKQKGPTVRRKRMVNPMVFLFQSLTTGFDLTVLKQAMSSGGRATC